MAGTAQPDTCRPRSDRADRAGAPAGRDPADTVPRFGGGELEEWPAVSDGHRTSSIQRPRSATRAVPRPDADGTRFSDLTRPIARDKQLVKGSGYRLLIGVVAVVVAGALMAALFVLPVKSWYRQRDDLAERQRQLAVLDAANVQLAQEVGYLQTPDGIKEAAREEVGFGGATEKRVTVLPAPNAPLTLPVGWPYDGVTQIIAVRAAEATAAAAPPSTTAATPTSVVAANAPASIPPAENASATTSPTAAAATTVVAAAGAGAPGDATATTPPPVAAGPP
ncbi:MAG: hypothetical protein JWM12_4322 [Ilumatobacteraceae bacterium]|nr:hypothetical protein [Ilumatobacteraceae bacterium]